MANAPDGVNRRTGLTPVVSALTFFALVLGGGGSASAHPEWSPIRVNRYAKVVLESDARVRLVYTILYGEGPALAARKSVDLDANGRVDEREKLLLGKRAATAVEAGLRVSLDGAPVVLGAPAIEVGLVGAAVAPEPYSVDLSYAITLAARGPRHELVLDDHVEVPSEGDTEISIEETPELVLVGDFHGRRPSPEVALEKQKLFTFRGPRFSVLEDRSVTLRLAAAPALRGRVAPLLVAALVALVLSIGIGGAALRWRARRRA